VVKVEIVNGETLETKIREKMILLLLGSLGTLILEQGTPFVVKKILAYRKRKALEAKAEPPKTE
jgi:hypothetical protein